MKFSGPIGTYWCLFFILGLSFEFSLAEEEFKCPEQFGYYPDLRDCSQYYVCVFGDSLHEKCTGGLFFSVELQTCDWPRNVECANGKKPEVPVAEFDDDEVFSSSRRTSATAAGGRPRPPNPEPVSNYQPQDNRDEPRDYTSNRPQENQRSRTTSVATARPDGANKQSQATTVSPSQKPNSNPTTLPVANEPSTIPEDPLYLSDERSKVSDPLGNYDPQQPDFDEAAPPIIDSEGGIHIADGGHGLDAFAGLSHLPGLGDYSVIAKPVYNANSGSSEQQPAGDNDYNHKKRNPSSNRSQSSVSTKPRSLESFQSNNGRSKDPDVVIDYTNGNKNPQWNNQNGQREFGTPPPTIFDDNAGHRDYGGFDVITPLKTNIQSDHEPGMDRVTAPDEIKENQNVRNYNQPKTQNSPESGSVREVHRLSGEHNRGNDGHVNKVPYSEGDSEIRSYNAPESKSEHQSALSENAKSAEGYSRLQRNHFNSQGQRDPNRNTDYNPLAIYRAAKDEISSQREETLEAFRENGRVREDAEDQRNRQYTSIQNDDINNQHQDTYGTLRSTPNGNRNTVATDHDIPSKDMETKEQSDSTYRRQPESDRTRSPATNPKDISLAGEILDADFGVYTGKQRQNRKLDISVDGVPSQNIDGSKGIIPAESIQPSVRQPNQIPGENVNKDRGQKPEQDFTPQDQSYRDEYDEIPRGYGEYDSPKPQYTDDYYTNQEDQETTTRSTAAMRTRPTRPRRPLTTTTTTTTTTTPAPIRIRTRRPVSQAAAPTKQPSYYPTTPAALPSRPQSVYSTPPPYTTAQKCDPRKCKLPDCRCGGTDAPVGLSSNEIPQIVVLTFDDAVNDLNHDLYDELFNSGRANPNGCPILGTFYVSHEWTDYGQVQTLYANGHEIASHSITHSYGEKFSKNQWMREIHGQREILHLYGGVKMEDIRGMRAPFLQIGGNKMFEMLYDANFTYDSSMPVYENNPPFWPYTLDYALNHECMIFPCPTKSYPGLWEVGMVMWVDLRGGRCSMGDACSNPPDEEAVTKMLMKNFNRHYKSNKAPFGLFYHSAWFNTQHHRRGFMKFIDEILKNEDVYLVTNWQLIQWMRDPTPVSKIKNFEPFNCRRLDRPPPCPTPTVCNVWYQGGVRYMKTCQPCPVKYPWIGNTGYDTKNKG